MLHQRVETADVGCGFPAVEVEPRPLPLFVESRVEAWVDALCPCDDAIPIRRSESRARWQGEPILRDSLSNLLVFVRQRMVDAVRASGHRRRHAVVGLRTAFDDVNRTLGELVGGPCGSITTG